MKKLLQQLSQTFLMKKQLRQLGQIVSIATLTAASNANAQISRVNTVMDNVATVLTGVSVTIFTICLMFAGFKMAFQQAKWSEISNIVIGGIIVGGAAGIAAWIVG